MLIGSASQNETALTTEMRTLGKDLLSWRETDAARTVLSKKDLKLQADRWAHERLSGALSALWPDTPIISEEDAVHEASRPDRYWLIDPIDGTASWLGGFSGFVTQAALIEDTIPLVGMVYAPALERFYVGLRGRGAWLNGEPLTALAPRSGLVLVDNTPEPHGITASLMENLDATGYVESGSLGLKCCLVADGTADLFVKDVTVRDWDLAPAAAIMAEIGAALTMTDGQAYEFTGNWEKKGFIAARSGELVRRATSALASIKADETP